MAKTCTVAVNGQTFQAKAGDVLLDAALVSGVNISHDCRSGVCGTCLTKVVRGSTILGETAVPGMVHACQARILSDLDIEAEEAPEISFADGRVTALRRLAPDVAEMTIEPETRLRHLPGQYFNFKFGGFPTRSYSPTRPLDRRPRAGSITLQIRRHERGQVSSQIGREIRAGHPVAIEGPFGSAFFREGKAARLILVSSGTGFAPIWSIACAALRENPSRKIIVIAGVRTDDPIYMSAGLQRLVRFPNVDVIATIGRRPGLSELVRKGYPNDHLPALDAADIVYACGPAQMIEAVGPVAVAAKAQFYSDPFEQARQTGEPVFAETGRRLKQMLGQSRTMGLALQNGFFGLSRGA
jgi:3-phenylpropionate/trans-cinnamate dioxygenase ferredoxin reductase subunit